MNYTDIKQMSSPITITSSLSVQCSVLSSSVHLCLPVCLYTLSGPLGLAALLTLTRSCGASVTPAPWWCLGVPSVARLHPPSLPENSQRSLLYYCEPEHRHRCAFGQRGRLAPPSSPSHYSTATSSPSCLPLPWAKSWAPRSPSDNSCAHWRHLLMATP